MTTTTPRETLAALIAGAELRLGAAFIPYSQSRNAAEKRQSLNWSVTLTRNGRTILSTYYSAGVAYCPAHKSPSLFLNGKRDDYNTRQRIAQEIETGRAALGNHGGRGAAILPNTVDVIACLVNEANVLDAGSFEAWAAELGYDTDSRKAEATYRTCVDHALALRAALGDALLNSMREAAREL